MVEHNQWETKGKGYSLHFEWPAVERNTLATLFSCLCAGKHIKANYHIQASV